MGKATKSDDTEPGKPGKKQAKALSPGTVLTPVCIGAGLLAAAQAILPKVL